MCRKTINNHSYIKTWKCLPQVIIHLRKEKILWMLVPWKTFQKKAMKELQLYSRICKLSNVVKLKMHKSKKLKMPIEIPVNHDFCCKQSNHKTDQSMKSDQAVRSSSIICLSFCWCDVQSYDSYGSHVGII